MDQLKGAFDSFSGGDQKGNNNQQQQFGEGQNQQQKTGSSFLSGLGDKLNSVAGGGRESEKNEDPLDKGIDLIQERILGQGAQDNESAIEQAKDEQISDFIRNKYKSVSGNELPIADKPTNF